MIHLIDGSSGRVSEGRHHEAAAILSRGMDAEARLSLGEPDSVIRGLLDVDGTIASSRVDGALARVVRESRIECGRVFAWGRRCATWALTGGIARGVSAQVGLLESPKPGMCPRATLRLLSKFDRIVCYDTSDAQAWLDAGVPGSRLEAQTPTVALQGYTSRDTLRARLGVSEHEKLIFPIASPWNALDAQRFIFLVGLLRVIGIEASAIVPAKSWRLAEARVFRRRSGLATRLFLVDGPMTEYLPACDAAFVDSMRERERALPFVPRGAYAVLIQAAKMLGVPVAVSPAAVMQAGVSRPLSVSEELSPLAHLLRETVFKASTPHVGVLT